jgi:hypothetical protein
MTESAGPGCGVHAEVADQAEERVLEGGGPVALEELAGPGEAVARNGQRQRPDQGPGCDNPGREQNDENRSFKAPAGSPGPAAATTRR